MSSTTLYPWGRGSCANASMRRPTWRRILTGKEVSSSAAVGSSLDPVGHSLQAQRRLDLFPRNGLAVGRIFKRFSGSLQIQTVLELLEQL